MIEALHRWFRITDQGSTIRTEILGGVTTFLTMVYIIFVNPQLLSQTGMDFGAVLAATCLSAAIATWVMGLLANYPIALAPGMGENVFFLTVVTATGISWQIALAAVFVSGVAFFVMNFFRLRELVIDAVPESLKHGIASGIGLFIAFLGFDDAGLVSFAGGFPSPGDLTEPATMVGLAGIAVTAILLSRSFGGAILAGILTATALALGFGLVEWQGLMAAPPSLAPTFLQMDLPGLLTFEMLPVILVFLYMAVFDAIGTLIGIGEQGGFLRDGRLPRAGRALSADASGTVVGAVLGTSTVTAYVESATGVQAGARTGLANVVTGALFLAALFFEPLARMVGGGVPLDDGRILYPMTAPALVVVGSLMARSITRIEWSDFTESFPAFLVVVGIPFGWSIADGIAYGFIAYPLLKLVSGKGRTVPILVYLLGILFVLRYALLV